MIKTYYPDAWVRSTDVTYRVLLIVNDGPEITMHASAPRWKVAQAIRAVRSIEAADDGTRASVRWERQELTQWVEACPWCGVRPLEFEMDCDGPASTGTCGSPQCAQLQRCDGCGQDGTASVHSWRGDLCYPCDRVAYRDNLRAARYLGQQRYALLPV